MASPDSVRQQVGMPKLTNCRSLAVQQICHVQGERPADQLVATGLALIAMSEAAGLNPHDVISLGQRVMRDAEGPFTHQLQAIRDYAKAELLKR